jgi:2-hydroxy-6-oxonona-2,4-dienedioate hydrolase
MIHRFTDIAGASSRYIEEGDPAAPLLVLIHGVSLTSEIWVDNIDALGKDFHVVAIDMLGHGFTRPHDGKAVTIPQKLEHLETFVQTLGANRVTLCGSSYGALIAANLVLRGKIPVERLIINGSGSAFNTEAQLTAFIERIYANYRPRLIDSTMAMWRERMNNTVFDPSTIPCELLAVLPLCYAQPWALPCWEETIDTMRRPEKFRPFRILDRLEALKLPTLVVWGRDDKGGIYESAVAAVDRMPDAKLVAFEQCGHLPMFEHPERYNAVLREFLL